MKEGFIFLFIWLLTGARTAAQDKYTDSLLAIIADNKSDSSLTDAYTRLSIHYYETDPEKSIRYGSHALQYAESLKDNIRIARACQSIGVAYDYKGDLDSCLYYLNRAAGINRASGYVDKESHIISDIALAHYLRGNYELALRNHLAALRLREQFGDKKFIAISYNNIGLVHRSRKDYRNAIDYYKRSLQLKQEINDERGVLNTLINIGSAFQNDNAFDSAYAYATRALELARNLRLENDEIAAQSNMCAAMVNLGRVDEVLPVLAAIEKKSLAINERNSLLTIYESFGDAYKRKGDPVSADRMYTKGLQLSTLTKRREYMEVYLRKLAALNYAAGKYQPAYEFAAKSRSIRDSLWSEENSRQINEMSAVYESAEKEKKIESLNVQNQLNQAEANRRKRERNYFILSSVLLLGIAIVAWYGYHSNRKKNEMLDRQKTVIEHQLKEKEFLLKEIHHRVKNNLQVVSSLLNLQSRYIKDEMALDAVRESRNRVHAMAMIHKNLYQEENLSGIDMQEYITRLCNNLFESYNIHRDRVKLFTDIDPLVLDVDIVVPLGLILNELITNSLKYAFTEEGNGEITIRLKQNGERITLTVSDNGKGFSNSQFTGNTDSFGSRLIQAFVQKLKGEMQSGNDMGAMVEISFNHSTPNFL